jgi:hypothetical protein
MKSYVVQKDSLTGSSLPPKAIRSFIEATIHFDALPRNTKHSFFPTVIGQLQR